MSEGNKRRGIASVFRRTFAISGNSFQHTWYVSDAASNHFTAVPISRPEGMDSPVRWTEITREHLYAVIRVELRCHLGGVTQKYLVGLQHSGKEFLLPWPTNGRQFDICQCVWTVSVFFLLIYRLSQKVPHWCHIWGQDFSARKSVNHLKFLHSQAWLKRFLGVRILHSSRMYILSTERKTEVVQF